MAGRFHVLLPSALLSVLPLTAAASGEPASSKKKSYYAPPLETIEVIADQAPVTLANTVLVRVGRGRWFGVRERKKDSFGIQFFGGRNLRRGWIHARYARVLRDDDVDLALEALKIAKEVNPRVDAAAYKAQVDALADRVAAAASRANRAKHRARLMGAQLFGRERFRYHKGLRTLDIVLDERKGNCLGLSLLYLCAAERLKMPIRMLAVPRHVLVRYDDGREQFNIEPGMMGMVFVNDSYMRWRYGPPAGINWSVLSKPQTVAVLSSDLGVILARKREFAEAAKRFARAVEINPNYGEAYYNWGVALVATNRPALACDKFARATQIHPRFAEAYYNWGNALAAMGQPSWACRKFATAVECKPRCAEAYYNWGIVLLNTGREGEAAEKFRRAVALAPNLKPLVDKALAQLRAGGSVRRFLRGEPEDD